MDSEARSTRQHRNGGGGGGHDLPVGRIYRNLTVLFVSYYSRNFLYFRAPTRRVLIKYQINNINVRGTLRVSLTIERVVYNIFLTSYTGKHAVCFILCPPSPANEKSCYTSRRFGENIKVRVDPTLIRIIILTTTVLSAVWTRKIPTG